MLGIYFRRIVCFVMLEKLLFTFCIIRRLIILEIMITRLILLKSNSNKNKDDVFILPFYNTFFLGILTLVNSSRVVDN